MHIIIGCMYWQALNFLGVAHSASGQLQEHVLLWTASGL